MKTTKKNKFTNRATKDAEDALYRAYGLIDEFE